MDGLKLWLLAFFLAAFVAGAVFAREIPGYEGGAAQPPGENAGVHSSNASGSGIDAGYAGVFSAIGGGIMADASRSANTCLRETRDFSDSSAGPENVDPRFWSQIYAGPWFFADVGSFEFSLGLAVGRIARRVRWCFLILAANIGIIWKAPVGVLDIFPLLGIGFDAIVWTRNECLRRHYVVSDAVPGGRTFRYFSSLKLKAGFGRDFGFSENRFFRARLLGYYGRRLGNPHPWGGTLRLGFGKRL